MVADTAPTSGDPAPAADAQPKPTTGTCVGVLFVHGAGDHRIGATLIEFGEPLIAWLDGWLRHGRPSRGISTDRALTGATQIIVREGDRNTPAHSTVRLKAKDEQVEHTWLLAEARWDEAFTPPAFGQVLKWALGVVPWTVLTQFIGPLARQATFVESNPWSVAGYLLRVLVSAVLAVIASAFVLLLAMLILLLSLIPIDAVRGIVGSLQRFASTGVGDLYLVLVSPIQRAALSSAVQRDLQWMRDQGCERVAVIAHSQGGYVAYQALSDPWHKKIETFITFGAGVIRLTESERARRTPALVLALLGTVGALIAIRFGPSAILGLAGIWEKRQADGLAFAIGGVVAMLLVLVLWRYFHEDGRIDDLPTPIPWYDFLTTEDPVMNRRREGRLPERVKQIRTVNRGSVIADHGGYWQNRDEFVPQVANQLGALDPGLELLLAGPKGTETQARHLLDEAYERRRGRVAALRRRRLAIFAATAATLLILQLKGQLDDLGAPVAEWLSGLPGFITALIPDVVRSVLPIDGLETVLLGAVVIIALVYLASLVGSQLWNRWSDDDTEKEYRGTASGKPGGMQVGFYVWTLLQLVVLALFTMIGPAAIIEFLDDKFGQRDQIVQAWARAYIWTLVVGVVAFFWAAAPGRDPVRDGRTRVIGGVALALTLELVVAILTPGPTPGLVSIPTGIVIGIAAVALVWIVWPFLQWAIIRVARAIEDTTEQKPEAYDPASILDYLGFVGLLMASLAAVLTFGGAQPCEVKCELSDLLVFSSTVAATGFAFGLLLAVNGRGIQVPTKGPLGRLASRIPGSAGWSTCRGTAPGSSTPCRR
jgi:hypothetical protein